MDMNQIMQELGDSDKWRSSSVFSVGVINVFCYIPILSYKWVDDGTGKMTEETSFLACIEKEEGELVFSKCVAVFEIIGESRMAILTDGGIRGKYLERYDSRLAPFGIMCDGTNKSWLIDGRRGKGNVVAIPDGVEALSLTYSYSEPYIIGQSTRRIRKGFRADVTDDSVAPLVSSQTLYDSRRGLTLTATPDFINVKTHEGNTTISSEGRKIDRIMDCGDYGLIVVFEGEWNNFIDYVDLKNLKPKFIFGEPLRGARVRDGKIVGRLADGRHMEYDTFAEKYECEAPNTGEIVQCDKFGRILDGDVNATTELMDKMREFGG